MQEFSFPTTGNLTFEEQKKLLTIQAVAKVVSAFLQTNSQQITNQNDFLNMINNVQIKFNQM